MKTIKTIGLSLVTAGLLVACGGSTEPENSTEEMQTEAPAENVNQDPEAIGVKLNNGERWEANPETTKGITILASMVKAHDLDADNENPEKFANELIDAFGDIFKNCTMKGEAHEQLHSYLMPMEAMFKDISANDIDTRKKGLNNLEGQLKAYEVYFQ